jgi:hypothetical protein
MTRKERTLMIISASIFPLTLLICPASNRVSISTDPRIVATCEAAPAQMEALEAMRTATAP